MITLIALFLLKASNLSQKTKNIPEKIAIEDYKNYLMGKFDLLNRDDFVLVSTNNILLNNKIYLRKETYEAFLKMKEEASKEKIDLKILSGFRSFDYQKKDIWEKKWNGDTLVAGKNLLKTIPDELKRMQKILEYSAIPGTSRHHWGTEIDINSVNLSYFNSEKGKKEYNWMNENASKFGFCQPYNKKDAINPRTGYSEEKWHWSYLPISKDLTNKYSSFVKEADIKGFSGDKYIPKINIITNYVLGINPDCL